ncbi:hypothetical protein [Seonamhaeicola sp.]|uniref:hypothetical protein n=1 Tax=Seonamhaeicola sp. TaxID=1912245 RepID=UPI002611891B|nr:hypothetical protein [Seonamhaeicola sp.]
MTNKYKVIVLTYAATLLIICTVYVLGTLYNITYAKFTADPAKIYNASPFTGVLSNLGVLMWCVASSVCFFSGILLYRTNRKSALFLLVSGIFSSILLLDDLFMIHDYAIYLIMPFEHAQNIVLILYILLTFWYLFRFYKILLSVHYYIFITACFFLGMSLIIDMVFENSGLEYFIEDSFKFLGITSWMLFFTCASHQFLSKKITTKN